MKRIRVQLQEGFLHTHSKKIEVPADQYISVRQVQRLLDELYRSTRSEATWYPMTDRLARKSYGHAIVKLSQMLASIPPNGVDGDRNILRETWQSSHNREFRLDIENHGGRNLISVHTLNNKTVAEEF